MRVKHVVAEKDMCCVVSRGVVICVQDTDIASVDEAVEIL